MAKKPKKVKHILTSQDEERLEKLEAAIALDESAFYRRGINLEEIREYELFRGKFETFTSYVKTVWRCTLRHAENQIDAAKVVKNLRTNGSPDDDQHEPMVRVGLPVNERQARALIGLKDPNDQIKAWQRACEEAEDAGKKVTAGRVTKVVNEMLAEKNGITPAAKAKDDDIDTKMTIIYNKLREFIEQQSQVGYTETPQNTLVERVEYLLEVLNGENKWQAA